MFKKLFAISVVAAMAMPAMVTANGKASNHGAYGETGNLIVVSCYRGPWKDVIWDRPNAIFVDTLVSVGYDFPTAHAIGQRVCRDESLVGVPGALKAAMEQIWQNRPAHRTRNR